MLKYSVNYAYNNLIESLSKEIINFDGFASF